MVSKEQKYRNEQLDGPSGTYIHRSRTNESKNNGNGQSEPILCLSRTHYCRRSPIENPRLEKKTEHT